MLKHLFYLYSSRNHSVLHWRRVSCFVLYGDPQGRATLFTLPTLSGHIHFRLFQKVARVIGHCWIKELVQPLVIRLPKMHFKTKNKQDLEVLLKCLFLVYWKGCVCHLPVCLWWWDWTHTGKACRPPQCKHRSKLEQRSLPGREGRRSLEERVRMEEVLSDICCTQL